MPSTSRFRRQHFGRPRGIFEPQRDCAVAPRIVQHVASIGRQYQLKLQPLGDFSEDPRLISGGGADQQQFFSITHLGVSLPTDCGAAQVRARPPLLAP